MRNLILNQIHEMANNSVFTAEINKDIDKLADADLLNMYITIRQATRLQMEITRKNIESEYNIPEMSFTTMDTSEPGKIKVGLKSNSINERLKMIDDILPSDIKVQYLETFRW